jgi:hypothetical protein
VQVVQLPELAMREAWSFPGFSRRFDGKFAPDRPGAVIDLIVLVRR